MPGNTPYIIEADQNAIEAQPQAWNQGLYQVGTDLWAFVTKVPFPAVTQNISCYKSSDGVLGQAWTLQATGPQCGNPGLGTGMNYFYPGADVIYAAYFNASSFELNLINFTFSTITWSSAITGGPVASSSSPSKTDSNPFLQRTSGGDSLVVYWDGSNTKIAKYSGSWGAATTIGASDRFKSGIIDSSDVLHIITFKTGTGYRYWRYTSGSLTGPTTVATPDNINEMGPGTFDSGADEIIFPYTTVNGPVIDLKLLRGTPTSSPSWSAETAGSSGVADTFYYPKYFKTASAEYAFTEMEYATTIPHHERLSYFKKQSGVWGTLTTFWDEIDNPGIPPQTTIDDITIWSGRLLSDGITLGCTIGLFPDNDHGFCAVQYALLGPLEVTPLTLACPAFGSGTIGTDYDSSLIPSGGTPPYSFAITGGMLPPGLSLDPDTGAITGVPTTTGTYPYTATVTDSNDDTATADCSITISASPFCVVPTPTPDEALAIVNEPPEQLGT